MKTDVVVGIVQIVPVEVGVVYVPVIIVNRTAALLGMGPSQRCFRPGCDSLQPAAEQLPNFSDQFVLPFPKR